MNKMIIISKIKRCKNKKIYKLFMIDFDYNYKKNNILQKTVNKKKAKEKGIIRTCWGKNKSIPMTIRISKFL
jgi:hypothetical protein